MDVLRVTIYLKKREREQKLVLPRQVRDLFIFD